MRQYKTRSDNQRMGQATHRMDLQFLEFDCSEDSEGVVCWDGLAQPAARHRAAMVQEVTQLLAWAHAFSPQTPGPLEDGAEWDFDLHLHAPTSAIQAHWQAKDNILVFSPVPAENDEIRLSLSISGTAAFAEAFRAQWNVP